MRWKVAATPLHADAHLGGGGLAGGGANTNRNGHGHEGEQKGTDVTDGGETSQDAVDTFEFDDYEMAAADYEDTFM